MTNSSPASRKKVLVAHIGARRHYSEARFLYRRNMLDSFHTDFCATHGWLNMLRRIIPNAVRRGALGRLLERVPHELPPDVIRSYPAIGLRFQARLRRSSSQSEQTSARIWVGRAFCNEIVKNGLGDADTVYAINCHGLELLRAAREYGLSTIVDQVMAPCGVSVDIIQSQLAIFPLISDEVFHDDLIDELSAREQEEWRCADTILCGSQYVADRIRAVGGPIEKVKVVASGLELPCRPHQRRKLSGTSVLRVLFAGKVGILKGAHYLAEAARALTRDNVQFRLVGNVVLSDHWLQHLPDNIELTGHVPRSEMGRHYDWADVFCFPSLCEGSAMVTYEAMAHGLAVVTTPNAGSIVRDEETGFVIPPFDVDAIVDALLKCRTRLSSQEPFPIACKIAPPEYSLEAYEKRFIDAIGI